jgi:hypothetical protein
VAGRFIDRQFSREHRRLDVELAYASVVCAGASRTARGIAGQGGTLSKILRAGAVAIAASPAKQGCRGSQERPRRPDALRSAREMHGKPLRSGDA